MKGYWNRPEETKKSMHGDYFFDRRYWNNG